MKAKTSVTINLNRIDDLKEFYNIARNSPLEMEVRSDNYIVNPKSILGLLSLDLSQDVELIIYGIDSHFPDLSMLTAIEECRLFDKFKSKKEIK